LLLSFSQFGHRCAASSFFPLQFSPPPETSPLFHGFFFKVCSGRPPSSSHFFDIALEHSLPLFAANDFPARMYDVSFPLSSFPFPFQDVFEQDNGSQETFVPPLSSSPFRSLLIDRPGGSLLPLMEGTRMTFFSFFQFFPSPFSCTPFFLSHCRALTNPSCQPPSRWIFSPPLIFLDPPRFLMPATKKPRSSFCIPLWVFPLFFSPVFYALSLSASCSGSMKGPVPTSRSVLSNRTP